MYASLVVLDRLAWTNAMNRISDTHHDARTQKLHAANSRGCAFEIRMPSRFERLTQNETHDSSRRATISLARIHVEQYDISPNLTPRQRQTYWNSTQLRPPQSACRRWRWRATGERAARWRHMIEKERERNDTVAARCRRAREKTVSTLPTHEELCEYFLAVK